MNGRDQYIYRILADLESRSDVSQRVIAKRAGIALGLANLLMRELVQNGWVRAVKVRRNGVRYVLTRKGLARKTELSREHFQSSVRLYAETRDRIRASFARLSSEWPSNGGVPDKRVVFYGTGDVAEIGYVCLHESDLTLVGAIDDCGRQRFFGLPLHSCELGLPPFPSVPFEKIVVMSLAEAEPIRRKLGAMGVAADRVFWI